MLTIKNLNKLNNKTLGKKNFYVERITEQFSMDNTNLLAVEHQYKFEITNRKYGITIILNREPAQYNALGTYFTLHSSTGHKLYISKDEISNMDIFIDKLRLVALSK
jgi:hypothetical protein